MRIIAAIIEGLAGGMMLAMIASVMLPQVREGHEYMVSQGVLGRIKML